MNITFFSSYRHVQPLSPLAQVGVDGLSQLTALVEKGESRGIFSDRMPVRIQRAVRPRLYHLFHASPKCCQTCRLKKRISSL